MVSFEDRKDWQRTAVCPVSEVRQSVILITSARTIVYILDQTVPTKEWHILRTLHLMNISNSIFLKQKADPSLKSIHLLMETSPSRTGGH